MNAHVRFHLQGLRRAVREENMQKIQNEKMYPHRIEPVTLGFLAGHLAH